ERTAPRWDGAGRRMSSRYPPCRVRNRRSSTLRTACPMPNLAIFALPFRHDAMGSERMLEHVLASLNRHGARWVYCLAGCGVGRGKRHAQDEEGQKIVRPARLLPNRSPRAVPKGGGTRPGMPDALNPQRVDSRAVAARH